MSDEEPTPMHKNPRTGWFEMDRDDTTPELCRDDTTYAWMLPTGRVFLYWSGLDRFTREPSWHMLAAYRGKRHYLTTSKDTAHTILARVLEDVEADTDLRDTPFGIS